MNRTATQTSDPLDLLVSLASLSGSWSEILQEIRRQLTGIKGFNQFRVIEFSEDECSHPFEVRVLSREMVAVIDAEPTDHFSGRDWQAIIRVIGAV